MKESKEETWIEVDEDGEEKPHHLTEADFLTLLEQCSFDIGLDQLFLQFQKRSDAYASREVRIFYFI